MNSFKNHRRWGGIIFLLLAIWMGGEMACATKKPVEMVVPYWTGKLPVMVIAHRGFSGQAPENTLASFKKAIESGSDMIELDVRLSKDGQVVVVHDNTIDKTTNGRGKVADYTLKELKQFDAGSWFAPQFSGEQIPTLKEVLESAKGRILVNIEIKNESLGQYAVTDLADRALREVKKAEMADRVIFSSFYPSALARIKERDPRIWVALLYNRSWNYLPEITRGNPFSILNLRNSYLTKDKIAKIHREGMRVNVYTVNSEEEMEQFVGWGIDGIITNHPDRLIKILQKKFK
jgi:glycerophosphoryl diester phosphodiesterase